MYGSRRFAFYFIILYIPRLYISRLYKYTFKRIVVPVWGNLEGSSMGRFDRRARQSGRLRPVPAVFLPEPLAILSTGVKGQHGSFSLSTKPASAFSLPPIQV